ncbi:MAG: GNAT family N-acetyltransferase [bacterium]
MKGSSVSNASGTPLPTVRRFQAQEWALYRELRLAALGDAPHAFGSTLAREEAFSEQEWITRIVTGATSKLDFPMVVEDGTGRAVGLGWVRIEPADTRTATLYQVWVRREARREGIGLALLDAAVQWARTAGAGVMELHVAIGPASAIEFYRRAGFEDVGACSPMRPGSEQFQQPMRRLL